MKQEFDLPGDLVRTNSELRGAEGVGWLRRLPAILADCERRWSLAIGPPFSRLSYNYAAPATRPDGTTLVVKVCFPDRELRTEAEALRLYAGQGAAQLLDVDLEWGVLLLEQIEPGTLLYSLEDDAQATSIAATVMKQIWRPVPADHPFPTLADWGRGFARLREQFEGGSGPFPEKLVDKAEKLFAELVGSMDEPVVLHGDLHHFNILAAKRQPWLAIDPKGVVGEPAYETGALLRNPMPDLLAKPRPERLSARRMGQLAEELCLDRARIQGWAAAQAALSAWWDFEDHGTNWKASIALAEMLSAIKA